MRVRSLLAAGALLAVGASAAQAGFIITSQRILGGGPDGFDIVKFKAVNDGVGEDPGATSRGRVLAVDALISIEGAGSFKFLIQDVDFDGVDDLNIGGRDLPGAEPATPQGSYVRIYPGSWNIGGVEAGFESDPDRDFTPNSNPVAEKSDAKSFRVAGFVEGGVPTSVPRTFAVAVVSPNATVSASGDIAGAVPGTPTFPFAEVNAIPEPAGLAALGLGFVGLMARRRRLA